MSLNPIDRLFKSAFRSENYTYKDAYWKDMEAQLGTTSGGFRIQKALGFIAVFTFPFLFSSNSIKLEDTALVSNDLAQATVTVANTNPTNLKKQSDIEQAETTVEEVVVVKSTVNSVNNGFKHSEKSVRKTMFNSEKNSALRIAQESYLSNKTDIEEAPTSTDNSILTDVVSNNSQIEMEKLKSISLSSLNEPLFNEIDQSFLTDKTEFGQKVKKTSLMQFFIQGGAYYLQLQQGNFEQNTIPEEFETQYNSFNLSGGEIVVGIKHKGFTVASGVGVSNLSKTYSYKFSDKTTTEEVQIESNTYLESVDSTFSHYQYEETHNAGSSSFGIEEAVYYIDSNFVTEYDTTVSQNSTTTDHNVALAYQLNYVSIPVQVGYEIEYKRFFAYANVGIQLGVLSNYNGFKYNQESEELKTIITSKDLNHITLSYQLSVGVGYNITPTISVIGQPIYSSTLVGAFKDIKPQNISGLGGKVSLRYQF